MKRNSRINLTAILILAIVYFFAGKFGLSLAFIHKSSTAVWPPTGISLSVMLLLGYEVWPGILFGAFLVNLTTEGTIATSLGIAIGNTLEALSAFFLIRRYAKGRFLFDRTRNIFKFIILASILSPVVSATFGVTSLVLGGFARWEKFFPIWFTWWLGDMISALIITPFLMIWITKPFPHRKFRDYFEILLLLSTVFIISQMVFGGWFIADTKNYPLEYLGIPFLLYAVFRFGQHGAIAITFVMSAIAIRGTLNGFGPFALEDHNKSLLLLQTFMGTISITGLILATVIAERERIASALRKREGMEKFRAVTETANDAIVCADSRGNITYFNKAAKQLFGHFPDQVIGQPLTVLMPERFREAHRHGLARFLNTGETKIIGKTIEIVGQKYNGVEFPLELSLATWKTREEIFFSAIIRDLTTQKQTEQILQRKNTFILLLQIIAIAANQSQTAEEAFRICVDKICAHLKWPVGHAFIRKTGFPEVMVSTRIWHFENPDRFRAFRKVSETMHFSKGEGLPGSVWASGKPVWIKDVRKEVNFPHKAAAQEAGIKTGVAFPVSIGTEVVATLEFFSDQTLAIDEALLEIMAHIVAQIARVMERESAKKELQNAYDDLEIRVEERTEELKKANAKLKELDKMKSDFLMAASHELRTPLASIKGYVVLILQEKAGAINEMQKEFITNVKRATDRLEHLLSGLLNLSKIESGQVAMEKEETPIGDLLQDEVSILKAEAAGKHIALELFMENDLKTIFCDADKIREVIENLISNAFKYTPSNGKVEVRAVRHEKTQTVQIQVKDNGIGIHPKDQERIFDPFHRIHKKGLAGEESTGLGLALTKKIVLAHDGDIYVESHVGVGSTFTVILPIKSQL